jgi:hypothetical protein
MKLLAALVAGAAVIALSATSLAQVLPTETPASSFMPLSTPSPQVGPPMAVDDVIAESREYDSKPVQATGTAESVRVDETGRGPVLQFNLCGHHCALVLDASNPTVAQGATVTITGTFYRHLQRGRFSQDNVIIISPEGIPRDDSQDWRRNLDRWPPTPSPSR